VKSKPRPSAPITYNETLQQQIWEESASLAKLPIQA
jgi:hypothetical protein